MQRGPSPASPSPRWPKGPQGSRPHGTRQKSRSRAMTRSKYVYWCISHQQYVAPKARRNLGHQLRCKIVKLNLTLLLQVDFHKFSTWYDFLTTQNIRRRAFPKMFGEVSTALKKEDRCNP